MSDRSEQALRERLELARKATDGPWGRVMGKGVGTDSGNGPVPFCIALATFENDAAHIAANSPDVVRADLEEILALRAEVARLEDEVASLEQEQKFSDETEYALIRKLFDLKICHKEVICEQADAQELNFEGESGCLFCWRQWAIRKAREAESEGE